MKQHLSWVADRANRGAVFAAKSAAVRFLHATAAGLALLICLASAPLANAAGQPNATFEWTGQFQGSNPNSRSDYPGNWIDGSWHVKVAAMLDGDPDPNVNFYSIKSAEAKITFRYLTWPTTLPSGKVQKNIYLTESFTYVLKSSDFDLSYDSMKAATYGCSVVCEQYNIPNPGDHNFTIFLKRNGQQVILTPKGAKLTIGGGAAGIHGGIHVQDKPWYPILLWPQGSDLVPPPTYQQVFDRSDPPSPDELNLDLRPWENESLYETVRFLDEEDQSRLVKGAVADGRSRVIVELRGVASTANVTIPGGDADGTWVSDPPTHVGEVWRRTWQAPESFGGSDDESAIGKRQINFGITIDGQSITPPSFELNKAPVVMLHGLWGNPRQWDMLRTALQTDGFRAEAWPYPGEAYFLDNKWVPSNHVARALGPLRDLGLVAKKADIVAHSMGGCLAKRWGSKEYIRRIVTVGTPHNGSPWANIALQSDQDSFGALEWLLNHLGGRSLHSGAVHDLQRGLFTLPGDNLGVPVKAIDGIADKTISPPNSGPFGLVLWFLSRGGNFAALHSSLFGTDTSDWIVPGTSQMGGLSGNSVQPVNVTWHNGEPTNTNVISATVAFLDAPSGSVGAMSTQQTAPLANLQLAPTQPAVRQFEGSAQASDGITVTSPAAGTVFSPGDTVHIAVSAPANASQVLMALADGLVVVDDAAPFEVDIAIPQQALGSQTIGVLAWDTNGVIGTTSTTVNVTTTATNTAVKVWPDSVLYLSPGETVPFVVHGVFSDGVERDITQNGCGTTYSTTDASVATIDATGLLTAKTPGYCQVTVQNGVSMQIPVLVQIPSGQGIVIPANGSTLNSSSVTFFWNEITGASQYALWVDTTPGGSNLFASVVDGLSSTVAGLPTNGSNIYVRLLANVSGWQSVNDYTYTAYTAPVGLLQVTIAPAAAVSAGAQWQVDSGAWQTNGATVSSLSVGSHTVSFSPVTDWTAPTNQIVTISGGLTTTINASYVSPLAQYAGSYTGTYSGDSSGTWSAIIDDSGNVMMGVLNSSGDYSFAQGSVDANGSCAIAFPDGGATVTGQIDGTGRMTGTWASPASGLSGTLEGNRTTGSLAVPMRYPANPAQGFSYPYYLFVPSAVDSQTTLVVEPNNTGHGDDDFAVHDTAAGDLIGRRISFAAGLRSPFLVPVFPRPYTNWWIYTQALDRDSLTTTDPSLQRLDLQLLAMIADARTKLAAQGISTDSKVFIMGFSASGMFANRFTVLHPDRVKAAAVGSPGGWPIAPVSTWQGESLRYNVGVSDVGTLTGTAFDAETYVTVPHYFFIGDQDTNDSVPFADSYDPEDRDQVNRLFGSTPLQRWPVAQSIYAAVGCNAQFVTYPGVGHQFNEAMTEDVKRFFLESGSVLRTNIINGVTSNYPGTYMVGTNGAFYGLIVTNGGVLISGVGVIGNSAIASNNNACVTGVGSRWSNSGTLIVGATGAFNQLTINNNGTVLATNIVMGYEANSTGNLIVISGGNLLATNALADGALDILRGMLALNSGTVTVDCFYATNGASSVVNFNSGTLNSGGSAVNNSSIFKVGNGTSAATLHLNGGTHNFANGLFINTNSWLTGTGAISGSITNAGTIAPGDSPGILTGSGNMTLLGNSLLQMQLAGTNAWLFDQINVAGAFNFDGTLTLSLLDGFTPGAGDRFDLFDFSSSSGFFSATNLPTLGGSLFWNTSLLYTSGEIFADGLSTGSLQVTIAPQAAIDGGAKWQLDSNGLWQNSGDTVSGLSAGSHTVSYTNLTGWIQPVDQIVQINSGTTTVTNGTYELTPVLLVAIPSIAGGRWYSLALKSDGTVWGWGNNGYGGLGLGTITSTNTPTPLQLSDVTAIAATSDSAMALKSDGTVWAWGHNENTNTPVQVGGLTGVSALAVGWEYAVALKPDGTVWTWGWNAYGQLGIGTTTSTNLPVQVSGLTSVTAVAAGNAHTVALKSDGTVWTWGLNESGQLGIGTTTSTNLPVQVSGLTGVTAIAARYAHTVALKSDGTVWAWGDNKYGDLGDGTTTQRNAPVQVSGLSGVTAIAAGVYHNIALKSDGTVWAWGHNQDGALGDGTFTDHYTPVQVIGLLGGVTAITAGDAHSMALMSDGTVWAWGSNSGGQLGNLGTPGRSASPVCVDGLNLLVITQQVGSIQVALDPAAAVTAGAQWCVDGGTWQNSGDTLSDLVIGGHTLAFKDVEGWIKPTNRVVQVNFGETTVTNLDYELTPVLLAAVSRKTHGVAGDYDLNLNLDGVPSATIEPRLGGPNKIVFTFNKVMAAVDGVLSANEFTLTNATYSSASIVSSNLTLNLTNVVDQSQVTVVLKGVGDLAGNALSGTNAVRVSVLYGDVNQSGSVNVTDRLAVKSRLMQVLSSTNFLYDANASGSVNVTDRLVVKANLFHTVNMNGLNALLTAETESNGTALLAATLGEALGAPELAWSTDGDAVWMATMALDGSLMAWSGSIGHLNVSWVETTVTGPGTLGFQWKVSSEVDADYLTFSIDGVDQSGRISGEVDWQTLTFNIPSGTHRLTWTYAKNGSKAVGLDVGWLRRVVYETTP